MGVEIVVRGLKPEWSNWFVLSNVAALLDPTELIEQFTRTTLGAGVTLLLYLAIVVAVSAVTFRTRDLG
ncbi:MAG: hypothetical protein M5U31_15500 [Acidimicrobiia bacterium]|nr:hypothetical protein [Acidimicrobiia bacterium]